MRDFLLPAAVVTFLLAVSAPIGCGSTTDDGAGGTSADAGAPDPDGGDGSAKPPGAVSTDAGDGGGPSGPKRVFVTSGQFDGNLAKLGGPDSLCQEAATGAKLGGTWRAWISTTKQDAFDHIADVAPWYLLDGTTLVFASKAQLRSKPSAMINRDELGNVYDPETTAAGDLVVRTGTSRGGTAGETCLDWTATFDESGTYGFLDMLDDWTNFADGNCDADNARLYCFEQ